MKEPIYCELPIVWDSQGADQLKELGINSDEQEIDRLTINLIEIVAFNPSYKKGETTIRTNFGSAFVVDTPYEKFKKFFEDKTGIVVHPYES